MRTCLSAGGPSARAYCARAARPRARRLVSNLRRLPPLLSELETPLGSFCHRHRGIAPTMITVTTVGCSRVRFWPLADPIFHERCPLFRSPLGVKRTWRVGLAMSANDQEWTFETRRHRQTGSGDFSLRRPTIVKIDHLTERPRRFIAV